MKSPYIGMCVWPVPENKDITVTMFRDAHKEEYDNKDWFFILEDVAANGKRKPVAQGRCCSIQLLYKFICFNSFCIFLKTLLNTSDCFEQFGFENLK